MEDYLDNTLWRKFKYSLVFAVVIKGILIYCADLWYAGERLLFKGLINGTYVLSLQTHTANTAISMSYPSLHYCYRTAVNLLVSGTWSNNLGVEHNQISFSKSHTKKKLKPSFRKKYTWAREVQGYPVHDI